MADNNAQLSDYDKAALAQDQKREEWNEEQELQKMPDTERVDIRQQEIIAREMARIKRTKQTIARIKKKAAKKAVKKQVAKSVVKKGSKVIITAILRILGAFFVATWWIWVALAVVFLVSFMAVLFKCHLVNMLPSLLQPIASHFGINCTLPTS